MNIVIPMAGAGSRFSTSGYSDPKPLIDVHGLPMIQLVTENLRPLRRHRFIYICQKKHVEDYDLRKRLEAWAPNSLVVEIEGLTQGAACTVLLARDLIDNDEPLMIANSDQYVDVSIDRYLQHMDEGQLDGLIMTMYATDSKWSYVGLGPDGFVMSVVEKKVISTEATVGIYNFGCGSDFISSAEKMIEMNLRVNNEFYVAPVYNQLISTGKRIGIFNVGGVSKGMWGLGTPGDLEIYLTSHPSAQR